MTALIWIAICGLNLLLSFLGPTAGSDASIILGTNFCGLAVALILAAVIGRLVDRRSHPSWWPLALAAILGGSTVWVADTAFQFWAHHPSWLPPITAFLPVRYNLVYFLLIFALQTASETSLRANAALARREKQLAAATLAEQQAKLTALELQLSPHFLFNVLAALATLSAEGRNEEAYTVTNLLSDFLRTTLSPSSHATPTLADEMDAVQTYLAIEEIRFGDRLQTSFECEPDLSDVPVPRLILQPLVENAIKHAVAQSTTPVRLQIVAHVDDGDLILRVSDRGASRAFSGSPPGLGLGLRNVSARLQTLYGAAGRLTADRREGGFDAVVRFPLTMGCND